MKFIGIGRLFLLGGLNRTIELLTRVVAETAEKIGINDSLTRSGRYCVSEAKVQNLDGSKKF